jgi:uncharacterized protein YjbI with pentapeptide repeats
MKHQIKHRFTESVLFDCDLPDDTPSRLATRHALEKATAAGAYLDGANLARANLAGAYLAGANLTGANLTGAYLDGANLAGAYLDGANLAGAYLAGANLAGANLTGANLAGAYLAGANLDGANLDGANLDGAYLDGANLARAYLDGAYLAGALLVGERPIFQIGPIGSRCAYFTAYLTSEGVKLRTGCFFGTVDEFTAKLSEEHGDNIHAKEYRAVLDLIHCHAGLWTPPTP